MEADGGVLSNQLMLKFLQFLKGGIPTFAEENQILVFFFLLKFIEGNDKFGTQKCHES